VRSGTNFSLAKRKNPTTMNILSIIICFVLAYGAFALIAFRIVKVMFPNADSKEKRWRVKTPE